MKEGWEGEGGREAGKEREEARVQYRMPALMIKAGSKHG